MKKGHKHHIIPEVYLKFFTKKDRKLFKLKIELEKPPKKCRDFYPSSVCYKHDYYKFDNEYYIDQYGIKDKDILEKFGFWYENKLGKIIKKIIEKSLFLTLEEAVTLASALVDFKIRNDSFRQLFYNSARIEQAFDSVLNEKVQSDEFQELLKSGNINQEEFFTIWKDIKESYVDNEVVQKDLHNHSLLRRRIDNDNVIPKIVKKLLNIPWTILETTINHQFISSDNSGFLIDGNGKANNIGFGGDINFYFPLNPYQTLFISNFVGIDSLPSGLKTLNYRVIPPKEANSLNYYTMQLANHELYGKNEKVLLQTWYTVKNYSLYL